MKYLIKDDETGFYLRESELSSNILDSYFVNDKSMATLMDAEKAKEVCERFNKAFYTKTVSIEIMEDKND